MKAEPPRAKMENNGKVIPFTPRLIPKLSFPVRMLIGKTKFTSPEKNETNVEQVLAYNTLYGFISGQMYRRMSGYKPNAIIKKFTNSITINGVKVPPSNTARELIIQ